jgi:hypothetical protein
VIEAPCSRPTSDCQRLCHPPRLNDKPHVQVHHGQVATNVVAHSRPARAKPVRGAM